MQPLIIFYRQLQRTPAYLDKSWTRHILTTCVLEHQTQAFDWREPRYSGWAGDGRGRGRKHVYLHAIYLKNQGLLAWKKNLMYEDHEQKYSQTAIYSFDLLDFLRHQLKKQPAAWQAEVNERRAMPACYREALLKRCCQPENLNFYLIDIRCVVGSLFSICFAPLSPLDA